MAISEAEIVATLHRLLDEQKHPESHQEQIDKIRKYYQFIEKPNVFQFIIIAHPKLLCVTLRKSYEFEADMVQMGVVDVVLMDTIRCIRSMYSNHLRMSPQVLLIGLISPNSPLSILDGATIRQIMAYRALETRIAIMAGLIDPYPYYLGRKTDIVNALWETYWVDTPHRWAKIWMEYVATMKTQLPECCELYCDKCARITLSAGKCFICGCGQAAYVQFLDGEKVPPWIDIDTFAFVPGLGEVCAFKSSATMKVD